MLHTSGTNATPLLPSARYPNGLGKHAVAARVLLLVALVLSAFGSSTIASAQETEPDEKPKIAVFSGPTSTIGNSEPLVTSNKAREKYGLPLLTDEFGEPLSQDVVRPQRLAAPVTIYIEQFSAHPLESDAAELYGPPDGYIDPETDEFSVEPQSEDAIPVYEVTLYPDDGLFMLPYMALQENGQPWDSTCTESGATYEFCRQPFYPDASRLFEEIDRFGLSGSGTNSLLSSQADFDFYRAAPPGGYKKGLPEALRTDVGTGDIPPETVGVDFWPYTPVRQEPPMAELAFFTNVIQEAMDSGEYSGAIWLEGSPTVEESTYWFSLVIDTDKPIIGNASQRAHGQVGNEGDRNIVDSVDYIVSGIWADASGANQLGAVMIQEDQIFTGRDVQKADDRPGGYIATGGHGGIIGSTNPMAITFLPVKRHTYNSAVNTTQLPVEIAGVTMGDDGVDTVPVAIKDEEGKLLPTSIPKVTIVKHSRYYVDGPEDDPETEVEILARIEKNLQDFPLSGFVAEGLAPYGSLNENMELALIRAAYHGMPTVRVGRGNHGGITATSPRDLFIEGNNLTATKARILLMASIMKLGALPVPADPENPTPEEVDAIRAKLAEYQEIFDTH